MRLTVKDTSIRAIKVHGEDYISLTDIAKLKNPAEPNVVISNWMRNRNTIEFLGVWEMLYNPGFNPIEFEGFRKEAGLNAFTMSPSRWINTTNAIGIVSQAGRYGGTYGQSDIAFEFASWISVEFKLYLVKEFQRLKAEEQKQLGWNVKRELSKLNYLYSGWDAATGKISQTEQHSNPADECFGECRRPEISSVSRRVDFRSSPYPLARNALRSRCP